MKRTGSARKAIFVCGFLLIVSLTGLLPSGAKSAPVEPQYVTWLLDVARGELGYKEEKSGYSKYGAWAGDPYAQWCAEFMCWCVNEVDVQHGTALLRNVYPMYSGSNTGKNWFIKEGRYISRNGRIDGWGSQWIKGSDSTCRLTDYFPQPGDWVFFTWDGDSDTDHVAMVEYAESTDDGIVVHVIEGNNPDSVARNQYLLSDSSILGIGTVFDVADVTIRSGCVGKKVSVFQEKLCKLGYLPEEKIDGVCGSVTVESIRQFQKDYHMKETGIADINTQGKIDREISAAAVADNANWLVDDD